MRLGTSKWVYLVGVLIFIGGVAYAWHTLLTSALSAHCAPLSNTLESAAPLATFQPMNVTLALLASDGTVSVNWKEAERLAAEGKVPGDWSHNLAAVLLAVRDEKAKDYVFPVSK